MSVQIGHWSFRTKQDAEKHIRGVLAKYGHMQTVTGEDADLVQAIIDAHPNRKQVVGSGIRRIYVRHLRDKYNARRFEVERIGDPPRDLTWRYAIYPQTARKAVMKACRTAVRDQIAEFRFNYFADAGPYLCPLTGEEIAQSDSHVDHAPPDTFEALVDQWLAVNRMLCEDVELLPSANYEEPTRIADEFLEENWREYHADFAKLRMLTSKANLSHSRKEARGYANRVQGSGITIRKIRLGGGSTVSARQESDV